MSSLWGYTRRTLVAILPSTMAFPLAQSLIQQDLASACHFSNELAYHFSSHWQENSMNEIPKLPCYKVILPLLTSSSPTPPYLQLGYNKVVLVSMYLKVMSPNNLSHPMGICIYKIHV